MTDDFVSLKVMIVSEHASERELIRRGVSSASIPVNISEVEAARDEAAACKLLADDAYDVVLFAGGMPAAAQQALLDAIRAAPGHPLAILVGEAAGGSEKNVAGHVDGVIARPIELPQVSELFGNCVAVRLPKRVLIVDDSAAVRTVIHKVLNASRFHLEADEADGYSAAIDKVKQHAFDVVILDCCMSGKDGFETLAELKTIRHGAKILMITESLDAGMEQRARGEGAADFLYKPFFAKDIDAAFSRLLGLTHMRWN